MAVTIDGSIPLPVNFGGTNSSSFTAYSVLAGGQPSSFPFQSIDSGTSGQALISNGLTALPSFKNGCKILQYVNSTTSTLVTIASTTYTDTGLSATITPTSSSSQIFVFAIHYAECSRSAANVYFGIRLYRDATIIHNPCADATGPQDGGMSSAGSTSVNHTALRALFVLDSPNTTSAVTYKAQGRVYQTGSSGTLLLQNNSATSRILLLEVGA